MATLRIRQQSLVAEVSTLRRKMAHQVKQQKDAVEDIKHDLIQSQLKTLRTHLKRRSARKKERLASYQEELEQIKILIRKYLPQIS